MPGHARAWFEQAEADLRAAELSASGGVNEWACFQAQQAGEQALKALLYGRGFTSIITHSLRRLVRECEAFDGSFRLAILTASTKKHRRPATTRRETPKRACDPLARSSSA